MASKGRSSLVCRNKVVARVNKPRKVPPAIYTHETLQTSEECLNNTAVHPPRVLEVFDNSSVSNLQTSIVGLHKVLFQPYPSELIFQRFSPGLSYELPVVLLNNDKVPRRVKLEPVDSEYFHVKSHESPGKKVASGMTVTFTVIFTPQENKDYCLSLFFRTERECFEIPIRAIGPRAILNFADKIKLPVCLVKACTQTTCFVRNVGNCQAKFKLGTQSPFSVTPSSGTIDVDEGIQVTVDFQPITSGVYKEDMILHYHTGEDVHITLHGICEKANLQLRPNSLWFEKTFISLVSQQTVTLTNKKDVVLRYRWTDWPTQPEMDPRESSDLKQVKGDEERALSPCDATEIHYLPWLSTSLQDDWISIQPTEGEIWPNMTAHFFITFKPKEAKLYQQTLYCDVTGCESLLPLNIKGEGTGPKILLDYYLKDMKNVFIGDKDQYMVKVSNKGLIDSYFRLSSPDTTFGRCFSFSPKEGVILSGACQIVEVTFHSCDLGSFSEDLQLAVTGRPQPLTLTFRGCVIAPTFHFDVSSINFGDVAFGFPSTITCTLFNTSFVPMTFALRVVGDGQGPPSVSSLEQVSTLSRGNWQGYTGANEFTVSPDTDTVDAISDVIIKVTLCSNTVRKYRLALVVDIEGVGKELMTLPINARCVVPDILVQTPVLDYQRCFINCIKQQEVRLSNPGTLPVCYGVLDQEHEGNPSLLFHCSSPRGVILAGCSVDIPVDACAKAVGKLEHTLNIALFGSLQTPLEVKLSCIGEGPSVHVQYTNLDFGRIPVLTDIVRTLKLTNQSSIPAHFMIRKKLKSSFWRVEPSEGVVPPESVLEINIVANLKDTLLFVGRLDVSIQDSHMQSVALRATGTGTTLVTDKPLGPNLDLGTHFSHGTCQYSFRLTNQGKRVHLINWKIEVIPPSNESRFLPTISQTPQKVNDLNSGLSPHCSTQKPLFNISPKRVELNPGDSVDMLLTGSSDPPKVVQERLLCFAIIGQQRGPKQIVMAVDMECRFVAPMLSISSKQLNFCIKKETGRNLALMYEKLVLKNVSSLSLTLELSIEEPFYLCDAPGDQSGTTDKSMVLGDKNLAECWVCFCPAYYQDRMSRRLDKVLQIHYPGHPQADVVELHAEVHYPNLHLSDTTVDFGCVMNCTGVKRVITITNCSRLPVSYHWTFLDGQKHRHTDTREKMTAEEEKTNPQIQPKECMASSELVSPAISFPDYVSVDERDCTPYLQEIFDILPLRGHLEPEEQREVVFSFYGHEDISRAVVAQCHVEDGPTYEVQLAGEASLIRYNLSSTHLDFGFQLFHKTGEVEVVLRNTGKVQFFFNTLNPAQQHNSTTEEDPVVRPCCPVIIPPQGSVKADTEQCLRVRYLPGIPGEFRKKIRLQVAFLPPQDIILSGVGVFPRISLSLPRSLLDESHSDFMEQARAALEAERKKLESKKNEDATESTTTNEELLHLEVDTLLVKESALKNGNKISRLVLPEYVLDFGYVIPGKVVSHSVKVFNSGLIPVSFQPDCRQLAETGFRAELERVKDLPCGETHTLTVIVDARGPNVQMGNMSAVMAIQMKSGPTVQLRMSAVVTMPAAVASVDLLQFDTVQCGMCQMMTIQLFNHGLLPCQWNMAEEVKPFKKVDKSLPLYDCKRLLAKQRVFEMFPSSGMLHPGELVNIQIKFSPIEECAYKRRLLVSVAESSHQVWITAQGQGVEPHLEFCPEVVELRPCLPLSTDVMAEIKVRNPCSFPIEFYSLEFDNQYLEEEKLLRLMPGYYENDTLLLPPRIPGEGLPIELHNYYKHRENSQDVDDLQPEFTMLMPPISGETASPSTDVTVIPAKEQEDVDDLQPEFTMLMPPISGEAASPSTDVTVIPAKEQPPSGRKSKKGNRKSPSPSTSQILILEEEASPPNTVPFIVLHGEENKSLSVQQQLESGALPPQDEVQNDLGRSDPLGLPPITFSIVRFPENREQAKIEPSCFTFILPEQEKQKEEIKEEASSEKERQAGAGSKSPIASSKKDKVKKDSKSQMGKKKVSTKTKSKALDVSCMEPEVIEEDLQPLEQAGKQRVTKFRWTVPAGGEVTLGIWFYSESPGTFEQTFNFELLGNQKQYQLPCRGMSTYPSICEDYKIIFARSKKVAQTNGLEKAYAIKSNVFEFGPLLCSKSRDRYKENEYPENAEKLLINNNSHLEVEVEFCFQHDTKASTYMLDPPTMTLKPNEEKELTVMAYPTQVGQVVDSIVCRVKDKPEVVIINVSCWGVLPELVLKNKQLHFDRLLLDSMDSRSLTLDNVTALPVSWRLQGVEKLGDEFKVPEDQGVIQPHSSLTLDVYFMSNKQRSVKEDLRLEVSDVGNILGVVQTESIHVSAEAYDVKLTIKPDCFHDFGTIKVFDEVQLPLQIKNQGKYSIDFKMVFAGTELDSIFSVSPQSGTLLPRENATSVLIICKPDREVSIDNQSILNCKVIDPKHGKGEVILSPAVKVSLKSVFSRYEITPSRDMDFGPLTFGSKKSQSFVIKNNGDFAYHFTLHRVPSDQNLTEKSGLSGRPTGSTVKGRRESPQQDAGSDKNRLNTAVFSVTPLSGTLQPGSEQYVQVDCVADQLGIWNQGLIIDISDRDPSDHPDGIPYTLLAEVCKPGIDLDMSSILEEHYLCHNRSQLSSKPFCNSEGIYIQDENEFVFNNVVVGSTAQARLKLTNPGKVLCMLNMAIRAVGSKVSQNVEVFHLSTTTMTIPPQSHAFAVVTFTPQSMQLYSAVFEAAIKGSSRPSSRLTPTYKNKVLDLTLTGNGTLPRVCVVRPALRSSEGYPMLQFGRVLAGYSKTIALVLHNDGNVPAQVHIDMQDQHGVFNFLAAPNNCCSVKSTKVEDASTLGYEIMHKATLKLNVDETIEFKVNFCSKTPQRVEATISLQVEDNQYNNTTIQVTGETYDQKIVSLVNVNRSEQEVDEVIEEDDFQRQLFGDCYVGCSYQEHFIMTNHSRSRAMRFEWSPNGPHLIFSPQVGHLHAGCSKEVKLTFTSNKPVTLTKQPVKCKISQVEFEQPIDQIPDWDDRHRELQCLTSKNQVSESSQQPEMKKVIQTVVEPSCSVVQGSDWMMDLHISAVCDYAKFSCSTENIQFQDTMLYQTRIHELQIANEGSVDVEFSWQIVMDSSCEKATCEQGGSSPRPSNSSAGSGFPPSSALESVVGSPEQPPFHVEPSFGVIKPATEQSFRIRFSPLEVAQFQGRLVCSIPNLQDGDHSPSISVSGESLLPHCHFDLEDSDYLCGNRLSSEFNRSLDPETKVLEFTTVGISTSKRSFTVLNPTGKPFSFEWRCKDRGSSHFHCLTPSGIILPGQRLEVSFEYLAEQLDTVESLWSFRIEALSLSVPFLCVGTSREPLIYFDRPHLDFGELLIGHKVKQQVMVVNEEEESFSFSVVQSSLLSEDQESRLILKPMSGKIAPKERLPLSVSFRPSREGSVGFRMVLKLNQKSEPLTLPVKAEGFNTRASVQVEKSKGVLEEIDPKQPDKLDFGKVGITEQGVFRLFVTNLARFNQEVDIELSGPKELLQYLQAKPQTALVHVGEQLETLLFFCPGSVCILKDITMIIRVKRGPVFTFQIKGMAVEPSLEFSFTKHNFGTCFLYSPGIVPPSHTLVINNNSTRDISIQSPFQDMDFLEMGFQANILSPGAVMEVPFTFHPHEARQYNVKIPFILNSCVTKEVDILGKGFEIKLEVAEARHRKVKLKTLMAGQKVKKQVVVVNHSSLDLHFSLVLNADAPVNPKDLSVSPAGKLKLKPNGSCKVDILFSPHQHILPFTAELLADLSGFLHPLLTIDGCCQDVKVLLDPVQLSFGAVVLGCKAKKTIFLTNNGAINARFQWKAESFPAELSITPAKGQIAPGMKVPLEMTYAPVKQCEKTRYEDLCCLVEGSSSSPKLTVTGSCVAASPNKEVMNFACPVRGSHTLPLSLLNPTNQHCSIRPVIKGQEWSTQLLVLLEPHQSKPLDIIYQPLTMTTDGNKHKGSVFFSFPDGTGMLYVLQGAADPPQPEDSIVKELPAKTQLSLQLPVHNWLSRPQQFCVLVEPVKPDKQDATVTTNGLSYIDVAALAKREYKLSFSSYKEGQFTSKVTFKNEKTGEYLFYLLTFKVAPPGALSTIKLEATVRQTSSATVEVSNPLSKATSLTVECKSSEIRAPSKHTVPGHSKGALSFEYHPSCKGESTARLTLFSNELGYFHYDLVLRALPAPPEKTVHFSTSLGSSQLVVVNFISYSSKYSFEIDSPEYKVEKNISGSPGSEAILEVSFQPHEVGASKGQLTVSNESGEEYLFPLCGVCLPPKAQGPFSISNGQSITIPFKNVFLQTTEFDFQVESPRFTVKAVKSMLSKKSQNIEVSFEAPPGCSVGQLCSRLTVTSQRSQGHRSPCSWVYYLKGDCADSP